MEFPEGALVVPDVRIFRGPSADIPGTSRAGWVAAQKMLNFSSIYKLGGQLKTRKREIQDFMI